MEAYIKIVEEGLIGENSIPNQIRNKHHFDRAKFLLVVDAILNLIDHYKYKELVPKILSLCFVDISNHFFVDD